MLVKKSVVASFRIFCGSINLEEVVSERMKSSCCGNASSMEISLLKAGASRLPMKDMHTHPRIEPKTRSLVPNRLHTDKVYA
jgi:hypothetical protein